MTHFTPEDYIQFEDQERWLKEALNATSSEQFSPSESAVDAVLSFAKSTSSKNLKTGQASVFWN